MVEQLGEYRFTSGDLPIALVRRRVAEIANRFNLRIERWEEDGLGPAQGMLIRLASGKVILLLELEHAVKHHGVEGPEIIVEARDLAELGVAPLITEVLEALDLSKEQLDWIAPDENQEIAIDMMAKIKAYREDKAQPGPNGT